MDLAGPAGPKTLPYGAVERLPASAVAQGYGGQVQTCGYFNTFSNKSQQKTA